MKQESTIILSQEEAEQLSENGLIEFEGCKIIISED